MANEKNLIPANKRSKSEARENSRKGGIASGKARREKKTLKELLDIALALPSGEGSKTNAESIVASMINAAMAGDVKAFVAIRDSIGEKPVNKVEVGMADSVAEQLEEL